MFKYKIFSFKNYFIAIYLYMKSTFIWAILIDRYVSFYNKALENSHCHLWTYDWLIASSMTCEVAEVAKVMLGELRLNCEKGAFM